MFRLVPVVNAQYLEINGLQAAWGSNTTLTVADGQARDSSNSYDIIVNTAAVGTTINGAINGLNGLDTGALANNKMYYIYAIMDPAGFNPSGFIISLSSTVPQYPAGQFPSGYSASRLIGFALTDGSAHFLLFYQSGNNSARYYQYDAPVAVTVTASGTSATYSAMDFSVAVPLVNFARVAMEWTWTNNAAGDSLNFQPTGGTGNAITKRGIVAGVIVEDQGLILPLIATAKPEISYKTSAGTLNSVLVQGFEFNL